MNAPSQKQVSRMRRRPALKDGEAYIEWVMAEFGLSRQTVYNLTCRGTADGVLMPHVKRGRVLVFVKADVAVYMARKDAESRVVALAH
jgi:hypothetical protein